MTPSVDLALAEGLVGIVESVEGFNVSDEKRLNVMDVYRAVCDAVLGDSVEPEVLRQSGDEMESEYLDSTKPSERLGWGARWQLDDRLKDTTDWYRWTLVADVAGSRS